MARAIQKMVEAGLVKPISEGDRRRGLAAVFDCSVILEDKIANPVPKTVSPTKSWANIKKRARLAIKERSAGFLNTKTLDQVLQVVKHQKPEDDLLPEIVERYFQMDGL